MEAASTIRLAEHPQAVRVCLCISLLFDDLDVGMLNMSPHTVSVLVIAASPTVTSCTGSPTWCLQCCTMCGTNLIR